MSTVIIGDIHGCLLELKSLMGEVLAKTSKKDKQDRDEIEEIIFLGDLLDKGPYSVGVLQYIKNLFDAAGGDGIKVTIVKGNHEDKNFRFWKKMEAGEVNKAMEMKGARELLEIWQDTTPEQRDWLRGHVVPYVVRPEIGLSVVHGGIVPSVVDLPEDPTTLGGKNKKRVLRSMYIRYLDDEGHMIAFGQEKPGNKFWGEVYDGRFGHVFFGHQPWYQENPKFFEHATGIDLGCVHGGVLCAAVIPSKEMIATREEGSEETLAEFVMVAAKEEYCPPINAD